MARSDEYRPDGADFVSQHNLNFHHIDLSDDEELFTPSGKKRMYEALQIVLDTCNYPILVHDDTGKAAVTLLCALVRCYQNWALTAVFREGDMFAGAGGSDDSGLGNAGKEVSHRTLPQRRAMPYTAESRHRQATLGASGQFMLSNVHTSTGVPAAM